MTATELLDSLRQRGIELATAGDRLRYRPASAVTPELADAMKRHKAELLKLVATPGDWQLGDPIDWDSEPDPVDCLECNMFDCWWDMTGRRRCLPHDPPTESRRWLATCERIRAKRRRRRR